MRSSRRLEVAPRARADLRALFRYSLAMWGEAQGVAYLQRLSASMHELTEHPDLGRSRDDLSPGLRALPVAQHVIFYRMDEQTMDVIRLLHAKMDPARHLRPPA